MAEGSTKRRSRRRILIGGIAVVIILAIGAVVAINLSRGNRNYLADGQQYLAKGDYKSALIQLRNAVRVEPDNMTARYELGYTALALGDAASAEKELKLALDHNFDKDKVLPALARAYLLQGKFDQVLIEMDPSGRSPAAQAEIDISRGFAHLGLRQNDAASEDFKAALAIDAKAVRADIGLAWADLGRRDFGTAEANVDKAVAGGGTPAIVAEALTLKGQLRRLQKDEDGALDAFNKALQVDPGSMRSELARAGLYVDRNKFEQATADINSVLSRNPNQPVAVYLQALILAKQADLKGAFDLLQRQGTALGAYPPTLYLMARLEISRDQLEEGQTHLTQYIRVQPDDVDARILLGNLLIRKRQPDQALASLRDALAVAPNDQRILRALANASAAAGRVADAGQWLDRAAAASPNDAVLRTQIAINRLEIGQSEQAVKDLDDALVADPHASNARIFLVIALMRQGKFDDAAKATDALRADMANSPMPDNLLGGIAAARGDAQKARSYFEAAIAKDAGFAPALLNLARLDLAEGKYDAAAQRYQAILAKDPKSLDAMMSMADLGRRQAKPDEVVSWLTKAADSNPGVVLPRLALVNFFLERRDTAKALSTARDLNQAVSNNPDAMDALARAQLADNDKPSAIATYRSLIATAPRVPQAYQRLADAMNDSGDPNGALAVLRQGILANPEDAKLPERLALLTDRAGKPEQALALVQDWRAKNPNRPEGDEMLGDILMLQGKYKEAAATYATAFSQSPSSGIAVSLATAQSASGDDQAGKQTLQKWLQDHPGDDTARFALATTQLRLHQDDDAMANNELLLEHRPNNVIVMNNLAWLYGQRNDPRGFDLATKAHQLAPDSPDIADTLGYLALKKGDAQTAVPLLQKAYDDSKKSPQIGYHLAMALQKSGRNADARTVLQAVVADSRPFDDKAAAEKLLSTLPKE
ncbi:MAG TPA: XrtA/PEP-CTERM system TPR-repeat protein PrsT [Candidatus Cybelea sp.]|nr:XrtA/PEP-CTERM system TPR-repeat protein PrsT [Candidatus Cybelea sp.]